MEAGEGRLLDEGEPVGCGLRLVAGQLVDGSLPHLGFDPAVAAQHPLALDELIDERALGWGGGKILGDELGFELIEFLLGFVADDATGGVDAGLERIAAGGGFAFGGAGPGGAPGIAAVGLKLGGGGHERSACPPLRDDGNMRVSGLQMAASGNGYGVRKSS